MALFEHLNVKPYVMNDLIERPFSVTFLFFLEVLELLLISLIIAAIIGVMRSFDFRITTW
jgi:hypothetical protein